MLKKKKKHDIEKPKEIAPEKSVEPVKIDHSDEMKNHPKFAKFIQLKGDN